MTESESGSLAINGDPSGLARPNVESSLKGETIDHLFTVDGERTLDESDIEQIQDTAETEMEDLTPADLWAKRRMIRHEYDKLLEDAIDENRRLSELPPEATSAREYVRRRLRATTQSLNVMRTRLLHVLAWVHFHAWGQIKQKSKYHGMGLPEDTEYRIERNEKIKNEFRERRKTEEKSKKIREDLAEEWNLSESSIRDIVYTSD